MRRELIGASSLFLIIAACSFQKPSPNAYYGNPPEGYEEPIKAAFNVVLKDPDSAKYQFGSPYRAYRNNGLAYGGQVTWTGYAMEVWVNAKNSFGGYTGFQPYTVLMNG